MLTFDGIQMAIVDSVKVAKDRIAGDKKLIVIVGVLIVAAIVFMIFRKKG